MKNKILKLAKRLGKFSIEEIVSIIMANKSEIKSILDDLVGCGNLTQRQDGLYFYVEQKQIKKELPLFFEFHTPQEVDLIIKCFCADIEVLKTLKLLNLSKNCVAKFYKYFREQIYEKQFEKLKHGFNQKPKLGREREYMGKIVYLYIYNSQLFVSKKLLEHVNLKQFSEDERLEIKNQYLVSYRKVLNISYKKLFETHLTEAIWRRNKSFEQLKNELCELLGV